MSVPRWPDGDGRLRVVIERVEPAVDRGRFPIKRVVGEDVVVEADIFTDGHDALSAVLRFRHESTPEWSELPLEPIGNDRWRGAFRVGRLGRYLYTASAWPDRFGAWRRDLTRKLDAGQDVGAHILVGAGLLADMAAGAGAGDAEALQGAAEALRGVAADDIPGLDAVLNEDTIVLAERCADRRFTVAYPLEFPVVVERARARFSTWYEVFPRSCSPVPGQHGTFRDLEARLPYVASMGFDVLYLPPIHPIGTARRKGRNNAPAAGPDDPGTPWAIGGPEGGHKAVHPALGTIEDFRRLVEGAQRRGIEVALDLAFQCSPDHPWVTEHPEWFQRRPDGSIQYAENPPKRYEDIFPLDFESPRWRELWAALKDVVLFWVDQGVRIFRVDNPHTKPFAFWEWLIAEVKATHPDVLFLAEAFTRPKVMDLLAKLGFSQSYTYFAWRNTAWELTEYLTELTQTQVREYFRPNLWPNTPDILTEYLQMGGRPAFAARLVLAATLGASYGVYGPAFELCVDRPREPGSEEYADSEKYEIPQWDWENPDSLKEFIGRVNGIRRENPALHANDGLRFHAVSNDQLLCYSKHTPDLSNVILVVANLDPHHTHSGWIELPLDELGIDPREQYQVHDLIGDARFLWSGHRNYVEINPRVVPASVFRVRRRARTERDFDYYL